MALTVTRNDNAVRKVGSGLVQGTLVKSTGANLDTPDTIHTFGRMKNWLYDKKTTDTKEKDTEGIELVVGDETTCEWSYTSMQRDKTHIDLPVDLAGSYVRFFADLTGKNALDGKRQLLVVAAARPEAAVNIDSTDMYTKHKYTGYPAENDVTVDLSNVKDRRGVNIGGSVTIPAGEYHVVYEYTPS